MKRFFIVLSALLLGLAASAQEPHMKFLDIPLDGNVKGFVRLLNTKGFELVSNEEQWYLLKGEYLGYSSVQLTVFASSDGTVEFVAANLPEIVSSVTDTKDEYDLAVSKLTKELGKPREVRNNGTIEQYLTMWKRPEGNIAVNVNRNDESSKDGMTVRYVSVTFIDRQNSALE